MLHHCFASSFCMKGILFHLKASSGGSTRAKSMSGKRARRQDVTRMLRTVVVTHHASFLLPEHQHGVVWFSVKKQSWSLLQQYCRISVKKKELPLSASLDFINPIKLHISVSPHSEASKKTCTFALLLYKIQTFCLHSPTTHIEHQPFTPAHTLCPTAS